FGFTGLRVTRLTLAGPCVGGLRVASLGVGGLTIASLGVGGLTIASLRAGRLTVASLRAARLTVASLRVARLAAAGLAARLTPNRLRVGGLGARPAPAAALRRRCTVGQRLGQCGREDLLLVAPRRRCLQSALCARQALEPLPVAGHLEQLAHRVGRLRADGQPVLRTLGVDLDKRRVGLRVVLADLLDGTAIPLGTRICDNDPVVGLTNLAHAL